jgi:FkbM family methyltransferase
MLLPLIASIFRRLPIRSGLTRLSFNGPMNSLFSGQTEPMLAKLRDGTPIDVDVSDYHGRILYLFGSNDIKVSMTADALLRDGDSFLDIGANYSTIGLAAARKVGRQGTVHLFEPQKRLADRVRAAIAAGNYENVVFHQLGLMDVDGSFVIRAPAHHSGRATFVDHEDSADFTPVEECQVRAIGSYVAPLVGDRPFGAKLDIEGSEPLVMPWLVAQPNLRFLIFEAAHHHQDLYDHVTDAGLILYGLNRDPLRVRITRIDRFSEMSSFHDFVAMRLAEGAQPPKGSSPTQMSRYF